MMHLGGLELSLSLSLDGRPRVEWFNGFRWAFNGCNSGLRMMSRLDNGEKSFVPRRKRAREHANILTLVSRRPRRLRALFLRCLLALLLHADQSLEP